MPADLRGVFAKLTWADHHLNLLDDEMNAWADSRPHDAVGKHRGDAKKYVFHLEITKPPDLEKWGLIVGDCLTNLRSTLDHLVYALAAHHTPGGLTKAQERSLSFPICDAVADWDQATGTAKGQRDCLHGLPAESVAVINRYQPYHAGKLAKESMPSVLRQLNDIDKHRLLHPFTQTIAGDAASVTGHVGDYLFVPTPGPLEDGAEVFTIYFTEPNPEVNVEVVVPILVAFERSVVKEDIRDILGKLGKLILRIIAEERWENVTP